MKVTIQEGEVNEGLKNLNKGHNQSSMELVGLLDLNMQKIQDTVRLYFDRVSSNLQFRVEMNIYTRLAVFDNQKGEDMIDEESYNAFVKEASELMWLLYINNHIETPTDIRSDNYLKNIETIEALQANIHGIVLEGQLAPLGIKHVEQTLKVLPEDLRYLDISANRLYDIMEDSNEDLLNTLPSQLEWLCIGGNDFYKGGFECYKRVLESLPSTIKTLSLRHSKLGRIKPFQLEKIFASLNQDLISLSLIANGFEYSIEDMVKIFAALPKRLKVLNLQFNLFDDYEVEEWLQILHVLPKDLREYWLEGAGYIGGFSFESMCVFMDHLPQKLEILHIGPDMLKKFSLAEARKILEYIPSTICVLDFGEESKNSDSREDLCIPDHIETIGLK